METFDVREIYPNEYPLWDELVQNSPQGTIFQLSDYLRICAEAFNKRLKIYGCFDNHDVLFGGCSLFIQKKFGLLKIASSTCNKTPYGSIILLNNHGKRRKIELMKSAAIRRLCDKMDEDYYFSITITNSPDFNDIRTLVWRGWKSDVMYTYYINLQETRIENYSRNFRNNILKAQNNGIYIERSQDLNRHYELLSQVWKKQNLYPPADINFFSEVLKFIKKDNLGDLWVARDASDDIVASNIVLWDNKRAYFWDAAINEKSRHIGPNHYLFYSIVDILKSLGFKEYNIMQANSPRLTYHALGADPILIPYFRVKIRRPGYLN